MKRRAPGCIEVEDSHVINITASLVDQPTQTLPAVLAAVTKGGLNAAS
jgi:hypothetical protein